MILSKYYHSLFTLKKYLIFFANPKENSQNILEFILDRMSSSQRAPETDDKHAMLLAAQKKDVLTLTSLLQKGVFPNICDVIKERE